MITVKELMECQETSSPDGKHWEPALPGFYNFGLLGWLVRFRDAWAVLKGEAHAIRQTTEADIKISQFKTVLDAITINERG